MDVINWLTGPFETTIILLTEHINTVTLFGVSFAIFFGLFCLRMRTRTYFYNVPRFVRMLPWPHRVVSTAGCLLAVAWAWLNIIEAAQDVATYGYTSHNPWAIVGLAVMMFVGSCGPLIAVEAVNGPKSMTNTTRTQIDAGESPLQSPTKTVHNTDNRRTED